jgi:hypothetical protein
MDFGRLEESLRFEDWLAILLKSRVPDAILLTSQAQKQNLSRLEKFRILQEEYVTGSVLIKRDRMNSDLKEDADTCVNQLFILSAY